MEINDKSISEIGVEAWLDFINSHPFASIYHHPLWHRVIERTYGFRTLYRVKSDETGLSAALPFVKVRRFFSGSRNISYPFSDFCDPLVKSPDEIPELLGRADGFQSAPQTELRLFRLSRKGFQGGYYTFILDLSRGEQAIYMGLHADCVKRQIKKSVKKGVELIEADGPESLDDFYRLHTLTRKKHGAPVQPFRFFRNLWKELHPAGMLDLFLARAGAVSVASIIVLRFMDKAYYKFGASDDRASGLGANQALMWAAIRSSMKKGCLTFDLGRTFEGNAGLMEYKSRWGAKPHGLTYVRLPSGSTAVKEGSRLERIGSSVLSGMPGFSLKLFGELFYKFLA